MATKSKIEEALLEATGLKKKVAEKRQAYLARLIAGAQDLKDSEWDKLNEATQKWVNKGAKVVNAESGDIDDFPDLGGDEKEDDKSERRTERTSSRRRDDDDEKKDDKKDDKKKDADEEKPSSRRGRRGDDDEKKDDKKEDKEEKRTSRTSKEKPDKEKPAKKEPAKKERKGDGAQASIKKAIIKDPTASTDELIKSLAKKGLDVTPSAVSTIRSGTLQTLRFVKELGMPKGDF